MRAIQADVAELLSQLSEIMPRIDTAKRMVRQSSLNSDSPAPIDLVDQLALRDCAHDLRSTADTVATALVELSDTRPFVAVSPSGAVNVMSP